MVLSFKASMLGVQSVFAGEKRKSFKRIEGSRLVF